MVTRHHDTVTELEGEYRRGLQLMGGSIRSQGKALERIVRQQLQKITIHAFARADSYCPVRCR